MKKIILFFIVLISTTFASIADTIVEMEEYNGIYRVPCVVNGAKMKFIFDTGASNVCLSMTMAEYLFDNGYINSDDIIGTGTSSVADGRIVDHVVINIKDIEIGGHHLYNVEAVVIDGQNAPLLMGQSAIQKLGSIELNGALLTIKDDINNYDDYIDQLCEDAENAYDNKLYSRAAEKYGQLYSLDQLTDLGIYYYSWSLLLSDNAKKAKEVLNKISSFKYFEDNKYDIYRLLGHIHIDLKMYSEAINYFELSSNKIQTDPQQWVSNLRNQGDCYYYMADYSGAAEKYGLAISMLTYIYNVDKDYLYNDCKNKLKKGQKSYRDDDLDYLFFYNLKCSAKAGALDAKSFIIETKAFARAGNRYALRTCNDAQIDPYDNW
jgi:clan AA aspartic protease (TIGR02281 family)